MPSKLSNMRYLNVCGAFLLTLTLYSCGGGGGSDDGGGVTTPPPANVAPTANAGVDQTVDELTEVTLSGSGTDSDGSIASYSWEQTAGTSITLSSTDSANVSFTAPDINADETLTFKLTVTDNDGASANSTTRVTINPLGFSGTVITGQASEINPTNAKISGSWSVPNVDRVVIASPVWSSPDITVEYALNNTALSSFHGIDNWDKVLKELTCGTTYKYLYAVREGAADSWVNALIGEVKEFTTVACDIPPSFSPSFENVYVYIELTDEIIALTTGENAIAESAKYFIAQVNPNEFSSDTELKFEISQDGSPDVIYTDSVTITIGEFIFLNDVLIPDSLKCDTDYKVRAIATTQWNTVFSDYYNIKMAACGLRTKAIINAISGGTLTLDDSTTLTIPAGSLDQDTEIIIEKINVPNADGSLSNTINLYPTGTTFNSPIKLTISLEPNESEDLIDAFILSPDITPYDDGEEELRLEPLVVSVEDNKATVEISHFSTVTVFGAKALQLIFQLPSKYLLPGDIEYTLNQNNMWATGHTRMFLGYNIQNSVKGVPLTDSEKSIAISELEAVNESNFTPVDKFIHSAAGGFGVFIDSGEGYRTSENDENFYMGAKRRKDLTWSERTEIAKYAVEKEGSSYNFLGNETLFDDAYTCTGLIESAYESAGKGMTIDVALGSPLPVYQYSNPFLEDINEITVNEGDSINFPIYGALRREFTANTGWWASLYNFTSTFNFHPKQYARKSVDIASKDSGMEDAWLSSNGDFIWDAVKTKQDGTPWHITFTVEGEYNGNDYSKSRTLTINVIENPETLVLPEEITILIGQYLQIKPIAGNAIEYRSPNSDFAVVLDSGELVGKSAGSVEITGVDSLGNTDIIQVTVVDDPDSLIFPSYIELNVGQEMIISPLQGEILAVLGLPNAQEIGGLYQNDFVSIATNHDHFMVVGKSNEITILGLKAGDSEFFGYGGHPIVVWVIVHVNDNQSTENIPPVASFTTDCNNLICNFDASSSYDTDGSVTSYQWDFGDGLTSSGVNVVHNYTTTGSYTVSLTVTDDYGLSSEDSLSVAVTEESSSEDGHFELQGVLIFYYPEGSSQGGYPCQAHYAIASEQPSMGDHKSFEASFPAGNQDFDYTAFPNSSCYYLPYINANNDYFLYSDSSQGNMHAELDKLPTTDGESLTIRFTGKALPRAWAEQVLLDVDITVTGTIVVIN